MRVDSTQFALKNEAANREPRCVIRIEFDTASPHLTSHDDITGVPGTPIYGVVQKPSAISQRIIPDEGRSEIGSFTFTLVDKNSQFTDAMRAQLANRAGLRKRRAQFYVGYKGDAFSQFQLFQTQVVSRCKYKSGQYEINCSDITRELRQEVFRPNFTTLRDSVTATDLVIPVYDTSGLQMIYHGPSYGDAPNSTVGYARIEDEIVRYASKSADALYIDGASGRGCLNTKPAAHAVDVGTTAERRTKVEEFIYLEGPGPQLAYAILTGQFYGTAYTLPQNWNLGIDTSFVKASDFTAIGGDLWNTTDETKSFPFRFDGLKQQDGKKFLEQQIYLLLGCYSPVYADGTIGLRRMTGVISDAAPVATLTERELTGLSDLEHEYTLLHNTFRIDWAWNPISESYERDTGFLDADSIEIHDESPLTGYQFKGLHSSRATDSSIATRLDSIRDRYAQPPQTLSATVLGSLNRLEVGDIVRIRVPPEILRDFAGPSGDYNRSFEVQQRTYDWYSGDVTLELFGSSARPESIPSTKDPTTRALPDAWYTSQGASLSTVIPIAGNLASTGSFTINGPTTLTAAGAIFYWDNDLTVPNGCNITITGNVQIRIRGFLTFNGTINGTGGGLAGVADPGTGSWDATFSGNSGYLGHARGWDGIRSNGQVTRTPHQYGQTLGVPTTRGLYESFPFLTLQVIGGVLVGLPTDLRGTGGGPGGRLVSSSDSIVHIGDAGTAGGAGLAIICRGMGFGVSALITLNGVNSVSATTVQSLNGVPTFPGAGGAGGPGALLILLDGNNISVPVITGKFVATTGSITQSGNPMVNREQVITTIDFKIPNPLTNPPYSGYPDPGIIGPWATDDANERVVMSVLDMSNAAHRIQYVPISQDANPDEDPRPPPPTFLRAGPGNGGNIIIWTNPYPLASFDVIEVWASIDNNRTNAVKVGETRGDSFMHRLPLGGLYYYWIRSKIDPVSGRPAIYSEWERPDADDGESSNIETPGEVPEAPTNFTALGSVNGIEFTWSLPWGKLSGVIRLYEGAHGSPIASATPIWEGYDLGTFVVKTDTTQRDYWLVLAKGGAESVPNPVGDGLPAAASSVTSALTATVYPPSVSRTATIGPNPRFVITAPVTCTPSGGTPPYTFLWTLDSGSTDIDLGTTTFNDTSFSASHNLDGTVMSAVVRCTVTDSLAATAFDVVSVQLSFPSIA